jgi:hypothetical protein
MRATPKVGAVMQGSAEAAPTQARGLLLEQTISGIGQASAASARTAGLDMVRCQRRYPATHMAMKMA